MIELKNPGLLRDRCFINGDWLAADSGKTFSVTNPATDEILAQVADAGVAETRRAIASAHQAQQLWAAKTAKERSKILRKWYELVMANQDDLARILTLEQGKPISEARGEIAYGASYIEWFSEEAKRIYGDLIAPPSPNKRIITIKQPVGVVGAITPWNFPNAMLARKLAPALAAGCAVVAKPAAQTPLSAFALAVLAQEAGVPNGVINMVCGEDAAAIGNALTSSPWVSKISFTGSTAVGKRLISQCADTVKKITLELGGNAPFIVFDDADLELAVAGAMASKFRNAGQTCVCANRFYVQQNIYPQFVQKLAEAISQLKLGNGLSEGVSIGPLIEAKAVAKVVRLVADATGRGAQLLLGGTASELFYPPTLLIDVPTDAQLCREEIFGPVAALVKFADEQQVIKLANDSDYGLATYVYTCDAARIWRLTEQLHTGMLGINEGVISNEMAPFGGVKQSGWGREGSRYGIEDYLNIKYACWGGLGL